MGFRPRRAAPPRPAQRDPRGRRGHHAGGAWTRFANEYTPYDGPELCGVDLDTIAITQATWSENRLLIGIEAASERTTGRTTWLRVRGLEHPSEWTVDGSATVRTDGADIVVEVRARPTALTIARS